MKKINGLRKLLAGMLALGLACGCVSAGAITVQVGNEPLSSDSERTYSYESDSDVGPIDVFELRSNENVDIDVANVNNNDESVQCGIDILGNKGVVDISSTGVSSSNSGIRVNDNEADGEDTGLVNLKVTGQIEASNGFAIALCKNQSGTINLNQNLSAGETPCNAVAQEEGIVISENGADVNLQLDEVTGRTCGIYIESNSGTIKLSENTVEGTAGDGIHVGSDLEEDTNTGTISITANSVSGADDGIEIQRNNGNVNIDAGTVTAVNGGIVTNTYGDGVTTIEADAVSVEGDGDTVGISVNQEAGKKGETTVKADSVSATTTGDSNNAKGVYVKDGTVVIGTDENTAGTDAGAGTTGTGEKKNINGDVMAKAENGWAFGISMEENSDVTVYGDVVAESSLYARGVAVSRSNSNKGESRTVVEGSVTVKSASSSYGVDVGSEEGSATVCVQNGISASGGDAFGIRTTTYSNGDSSVFVQGDVKAESKTGHANAVVISNQGGGNSTVNVDGNVSGDVINNGTAAGYGIVANFITSDSSAQVEINGILSGTAAAILVNDEKDAIDTTKADISVWAAEENGAGNIAVPYSTNPSEDAKNQAKALEDSIHYIIRIADAFKEMLTNDAVTPEKSTKTVTFGEGEDQKVYKTANKGEKVTIDASRITLSENEVLEGVYYYYDKPEENEDAFTSDVITENTNGIYTLTMGMSTILDNVRGMMQLGLKTHTHDFSEFVAHEKEPTCTETGLDVYKCKYCDATITETVATNPNNHTLANGDAKAVTCTEDGWEAYQYCTQCDYSTKVVITAKGHTEVADAAVPATCTESGLTAGKHCSACKEVLVAQEVIPAGHTPGDAVPENEIPPKNGVSGSYDEVVYCKVCKEELSRKTVIVPPPKDDAKGNPNAGEDDVTEFKPVIQNEIDLNDIAMPVDVSSDNDDVVLEKLANCPDALKETAKQELAALKRSGYKIDCGCVAWPKSSATAACTLKLSEKDVPDGAQIFVNGAAVQAERKDGYYYFDITLPAVVLVAHK